MHSLTRRDPHRLPRDRPQPLIRVTFVSTSPTGRNPREIVNFVNFTFA
jgi:hypothetical protein